MTTSTLKWRDDPVYDLEGVSRNLEQLQTLLLAGVLRGEALKGVLTGELPEPGFGAESVKTAAIAKEAVTAPKIGPEAVTTAKVATEAITSPKLAKVEYTQVAAVRKPKEEFEVSATRTATVLWVNAAGKTTSVKVNKVNVLPETIAPPVGGGAFFSFKVPFGQKWEWEGEGEGHSTYILE